MTDTDLLTGPRLRELRRRRGWSQEALARRVRVTTQSIRDWEAGRTPVSPAMALLLRTILTANGGTTA
jgi:transcriptional regulator with XRE-family HTH domain